MFLSTVSADVNLIELGITLVHPTVDFDILSQFGAVEIQKADSLTQAILNGDVTWKKEISGPVQVGADYDPDYALARQLSTGTGAVIDRLILGKVFRSFSANFTITNEDFILGQGSSAYQGELPDALTAIQPVTVKNIGAGDLTIIGIAGQNVDNDPAGVILRGGRKNTVTFYPIGGHWWLA